EALSGELVGEAADTYSLATITYHLLTGKHPYRGRTQRDLLQQLLRSDPVPMNDGESHIPLPIEKAVMTGLSRDPTKRQPNVRAFAQDVAKAVAQISSEAPPPTSAPAPKPARSGLRGFLDRLSGQKPTE